MLLFFIVLLFVVLVDCVNVEAIYKLLCILLEFSHETLFGLFVVRDLQFEMEIIVPILIVAALSTPVTVTHVEILYVILMETIYIHIQIMLHWKVSVLLLLLLQYYVVFRSH